MSRVRISASTHAEGAGPAIAVELAAGLSRPAAPAPAPVRLDGMDDLLQGLLAGRGPDEVLTRLADDGQIALAAGGWSGWLALDERWTTDEDGPVAGFQADSCRTDLTVTLLRRGRHPTEAATLEARLRAACERLLEAVEGPPARRFERTVDVDFGQVVSAFHGGLGSGVRAAVQPQPSGAAGELVLLRGDDAVGYLTSVPGPRGGPPRGAGARVMVTIHDPRGDGAAVAAGVGARLDGVLTAGRLLPPPRRRGGPERAIGG